MSVDLGMDLCEGSFLCKLRALPQLSNLAQWTNAEKNMSCRYHINMKNWIRARGDAVCPFHQPGKATTVLKGSH